MIAALLICLFLAVCCIVVQQYLLWRAEQDSKAVQRMWEARTERAAREMRLMQAHNNRLWEEAYRNRL